jgi:hypothetical protein
MIVALSRFGTFTGLEYMQSGDSPESFPNTSTFTFSHASYTSQYISFVAVEVQDRYHNSLQTPTNDQQALWSQYDPPGNGFPFIDLANQYVAINSQYSPGNINGLTWTGIASQLDTPSSAVAQNIDGAANRLITALCKIDNGQPASVCSQPYANLQAPISPYQTSPAQDNFMMADQIGIRVFGKAD